MADELEIKVVYSVDDSALQKSLAKVQGSTSKALSGGSGSSTPQTAIDRSLIQAGKLQDRLKLLGEAHARLASQPGFERSLSKVGQEMASIYSQQKRLSSGVGEYIANLNKQVELQKQARNLMNNADGGNNQFSAHSQRQMAMFQQIAGQVPGGSLVNKFISGASRGAAGAAEGGMGGLSGGLAGGGMAVAAGAAALAVGAVVSEMGQLAARAQELSQSASSATSSLGQLRSQTERTKIQQDASAVSGGVTVASIQQGIEQTKNSILGGVVDFITGKSPQAKQKDVQAAISGGLGGDDRETWRRQLEAGKDLNIDLARQRQGLDIQQNRANRDYALDVKQFNIESANQLFDLKKGQARQEQDYQIARQQFNEQFQEKQAAKSFALSQQYAQQDYQLTKARQTQDLQISLGDKSYDFGVSRQRQFQDYSIQKSDTKFDFNKSVSRNQESFNIDQGRQGQDYQENLLKMSLSGADSKSYLFASMDYRKQVQRQQEDFARQKKLATEDFSTQEGRTDRNFNLGQGRNLADYNLSNQRDLRGFNLGQQRQGQDLGISMQRSQQARDMQVDAELYSRKYQGIALEMSHNRNLEDASIALQRFTQATGMQKQRLSNQGADLAQDVSLQNRDFGISAYRSLRDYGYQQQDMAGALRDKNPLGAYGQGLVDPVFQDALSRNAAATGKLPLGSQVQAAINPGNMDAGNTFGQILGQSIPLLGLASLGFQAVNGLFGGGSQQQGGQGANLNYNGGNKTYNFSPGMDQNIMQQVQQIVDKGDANTQAEIMDFLRRQYGG